MMRRPWIVAGLVLLMAGASACSRGDNAGSGSAAPAAAPAPVPASATPSETPAPPGEFSSESVPVTTATLPPFPFFATPDGLVSLVREKDRIVNFDAQYFMVGSKPTLVEGRIFRDRFSLTQERPYSELEFHRNYENLIAALGGRKISTAQYTVDVINAAGGRPVLDKHNYGAAPAPAYRHDSYLVRTPDGKEYWIEISTGSFPLHGYVVVLEKQGMAQSVGLLSASDMKKAIDADGRVALQINFDVDKATLRADAQPVLEEIHKLLVADPALKLSIEGHTDTTGDAQRNRDLSTARARSVLGALVGLGVAPDRLQSRGFGPDRPVADNASDAGRAKNRRVELVKIAS